MKKLLIISVSLMLTIVAGCGGTKTANLTPEIQDQEMNRDTGISKIQDEIKGIISKSDLAGYVEGEIKFIPSQEDPNQVVVHEYNISIPTKRSYLEMKMLDQYLTLSKVNQDIFDYQERDDTGMYRKSGLALPNTDGERVMHESLVLTFGNEGDTYTIRLVDEIVERNHVDRTGEKLENDVYANISNKKYKLYKSGAISEEEPKSSAKPTSNTKPAATRWIDLSQSSKEYMVSSSIKKLKNAGYNFKVDESYFIIAIDAYFDGNESDTSTVDELVEMIGLAGGAIAK